MPRGVPIVVVDEVIRVRAPGPRPQPLLHLLVALDAECVGPELLQADLPLAGLPSGRSEGAVPEELVLDSDGAGVEVYVAPPDAEDLALAHPGRDREAEQGSEPVASERVEERVDLRGVPRADDAGIRLGRLHAQADVRAHLLRPYGLVERDPEDVKDVRRGRGRDAGRADVAKCRLHLLAREPREHDAAQLGPQVVCTTDV